MHLTPRLAVLLTLPPLLWAGNAVVGRLAVGLIGPLWLNAARWALALLILLPLGWRAVGSPAARAQVAARWPYLAALSLTGVGLYNALQYLALRTSTPLNVTLITASSPVWMMALGALFYGERPSRPQLVGAACSLLGVALVLARGDLATLREVQFVPGDLLMLLAVASWAVYSWLLARPPAHMQGTARPAWGWAEFLLVQVVLGLGWATASALAGELVLPPQTPQWGWPLTAVLGFVAIGPAVLAYRCWGLGVAEAGPAVAAFFANLTPLFAALLSAALLGEWPRAYHGLAFACIVAGIWASSRPSARRHNGRP